MARFLVRGFVELIRRVDQEQLRLCCKLILLIFTLGETGKYAHVR
jgi:hypothetical protein